MCVAQSVTMRLPLGRRDSTQRASEHVLRRSAVDRFRVHPDTADFAENAEIIQMLTSLGVDYAQGYGVAQPQRVLKSAVA